MCIRDRYKLLALFGTASAAAAAAPAPSPLAIVIDPAMEVFAKGVDALTEVSGWVLAVPQSLADAAVWWIDLNLGMPALIRDVLTGDSVRARVPRPSQIRTNPASPGRRPRTPLPLARREIRERRVLFFNSGRGPRTRDSCSRPLTFAAPRRRPSTSSSTSASTSAASSSSSTSRSARSTSSSRPPRASATTTRASSRSRRPTPSSASRSPRRSPTCSTRSAAPSRACSSTP